MSIIGRMDTLSHKPYVSWLLPERVKDWICDRWDAKLDPNKRWGTIESVTEDEDGLTVTWRADDGEDQQ